MNIVGQVSSTEEAEEIKAIVACFVLRNRVKELALQAAEKTMLYVPK